MTHTHFYTMRIAACALFLLVLQSVSAQQVSSNRFGQGIEIVAADSSFSMKFSTRIQTLMLLEQPDKFAFDQDLSANWSIRRSRLKFSGFAHSTRLRYKIELGLSNRDHGGESVETNNTSNLILDAFLHWKVAGDFEIWLGQTKLPGNRERVISSQKLQFVDRSLVNSRFNLDRDIGIQFRNAFQWGSVVAKQAIAISQGEGRNRTVGNQGGMELTGRLEVLPLGEFTGKGDYFGADLKREPTPKISLGASYDLNAQAARQRGNLGSYVPDTAYSDLHTLLVDLMFKYQGFSVMAEYADKRALGTRLVDESGDWVSNYYTGTGLNVQAGYVLPSNLEFAVRYTTVSPEYGSGRDRQDMYTLGCSKYIVGHSLKVQCDVSYLEETAPLIEASSGAYIYRFQVEMAF